MVTKQELLRVVKQLPTGRAPGPDRIPNEILKLIIPSLADDLAQAISQRFASGSLPRDFKNSTTVVLRKDQKSDYSLPGSYRPIALEDTLAKLMEKLIADRISQAAEEHALLP